MIDLSIIVVSWNTRTLLQACLASLNSAIADVQSSYTVETFVIDNASTDGSADMVRECFPWVQLVVNAENRGFARANNQAMKLATGTYLLLLNSDTVAPPTSLAALLSFAESQPRAGAIGVQLLNADSSFQAAYNDFPTVISALAEVWGVVQRLTRNLHYPSCPPEKAQTARQCDWIGGACLLLRQEAISEVGLLDEAFFMNSEEVDLCFRMHAHGWQVWYTPAVHILHQGGASADRRSGRQRMRLYEGKVRFIGKHYGKTAASFIRLNYRLASLIKSVFYGACSLIWRNEGCRKQALSHWQVVKETQWA